MASDSGPATLNATVKPQIVVINSSANETSQASAADKAGTSLVQLPAAPSSKATPALPATAKPAKGKGAAKKEKSLVTVAAGNKRSRKQASVDALTKSAVANASAASAEDESWTE